MRNEAESQPDTLHSCWKWMEHFSMGSRLRGSDVRVARAVPSILDPASRRG
jgi:hypothetical protein